MQVLSPLDLRERKSQRSSRRDLWVVVIAACAIVLSIVVFVAVAMSGGTLLYTDTQSHLSISRRVLDSSTPGLAQLGNVWLPFQHVLMLPLVWFQPFYQTGFAGSAVSMVAYVVTVVLLYKITFRLTGQKVAGVVAAGVFALNANVLYLQSTPMTELLLFCLLAATTYGLQQWADTGRYQYLVWASLAAMLSTLTRYEAWPIVLVVVLVVNIIAWQQHSGLPSKLHRRRVFDRVVVFNFWAFTGIVGWLVWNQIIFGNALDFQFGEFAKASLWTSQSEPAVHHPLTAIATYWYAVQGNLSWSVLLLAVVGLACLAAFEWREKRLVRALPVLSLLVIVPFFISMLWAGQRPLHVMEINNGLYNMRFGLVLVLPVAVFVSYLVGSLSRLRDLRRPQMVVSLVQRFQMSEWRAQAVAGGLVLTYMTVLGGVMLLSGSVVTYAEPVGWQYSVNTRDQNQVAAYMRGHYDGQSVLMESSGNEAVSFRLPTNRQIYEGSNAHSEWKSSLRYPADHGIGWIIARRGDVVDTALVSGNPRQLSRYQEVFRTPDGVYKIFELRRIA